VTKNSATFSTDVVCPEVACEKNDKKNQKTKEKNYKNTRKKMTNKLQHQKQKTRTNKEFCKIFTFVSVLAGDLFPFVSLFGFSGIFSLLSGLI
jgi:hypothetical protein